MRTPCMLAMALFCAAHLFIGAAHLLIGVPLGTLRPLVHFARYLVGPTGATRPASFAKGIRQLTTQFLAQLRHLAAEFLAHLAHLAPSFGHLAPEFAPGDINIAALQVAADVQLKLG